MRTVVAMRPGHAMVMDPDGKTRVGTAGMVAVCDDGAAFIMTPTGWKEIEPVPGTIQAVDPDPPA